MALTEKQKRQVAILIGSGMSAAAAYKIASGLEGGAIKLGTDYMHNYPKGYYQKGITELKRSGLIAKEAAKSIGRIAKGGVFIPQTIAYKETGIAPFMHKFYNNANRQIDDITRQYINKEILYDDAKFQIRNLEKQIHHKLTSDFSNNTVFGTKSKKALKDYAGKYVKVSSIKDFKINAGGKGIADYITGQWSGDGVTSHNMKGLKYMKYKNIPFADVLRGAQFDPRMYKAMLALKNHGKDLHTGASLVQSMGNKYWNPNVQVTKGKVLFQLSPVWKSNFDWGGYNAVGIWDPKKSGKIRIIATDYRNLKKIPVPNHVINYVDSKEITIKDSVRKIAEVDPSIKKPEPKPRKTRSDKGKSRTSKARRLELSKTLRVGGTRNTLKKEQSSVFNRFEKRREKVRKIMRKPNLFNKTGQRQLARLAPSIIKRFGATGLLLGGAYALINKLREK